MGKLGAKLAGLKHKIVTDTNLCRARRGIVRGVEALPSATGRNLVQKVPVVRWLPQYAPQWIVDDFIAGITVGIVLIPQALAFAVIAGIPPQSGLIATVLPPAIYSLMGTSKDISTGPTSVTGLLTSSIVLLLTQNKIPAFIAASTVAFSMGIISLVFGALKLGFLLDFLSVPVLTGFMMGQALVINFAQIPILLGESGVGTVFAQQMQEIIKNIRTSQPLTIAIGFSGVAVLLLLQFLGKKWGQQFASIRIIVYMRSAFVLIVYTTISFFVNKDLEKPVWAVIGTVPRGLLQPMAPNPALLKGVVFLAFPIFFSTALEHLALARSFGRLNGYTIDASQEMVYLGVANMANGVMGGMAVGGNIARSAINNASGVKTPLSGIFTTLFMILAIYELNTVIFYIPQATLAAVTLVAVLEVNPPQAVLGKYWKTSFADFIATILSFNFSFLATPEIGVGLAVAFSVLYTVLCIMFSHAKPITKTDLEHQYGLDPSPLPVSNHIPSGTQVMSLSQHIIFLNAYRMKRNIMDQVQTYYEGAGNEPKNSDRVWSDLRKKEIIRMRRKANIMTPTKFIPSLRVLILDFTHTTFIDTTGLTMLEELKKELRTWGGEDVELRFVGLSPEVLFKFKRIGWQLADSDEALRTDLDRDADAYFELLKPAIQAQSRIRDSAELDFGFGSGNVMVSQENMSVVDYEVGKENGKEAQTVITTSVYTRDGRAYTRNSE